MVPVPFLQPGQYFREREPGLSYLIAVTVVAMVITAGFAGIGWLFATSLPDHLTVENPDRPPEMFCEDAQPGDVSYEECQRPARVPASGVLWEEIQKWLALAFGGVIVGWVGIAGVMHLLALAFDDPEATFGNTLAVAAWGMVPLVVPAVVNLIGVWWFLRERSPTGGIVARADAMREFLAGPVFIVVFALVAGWQAYIYYHGLRQGQGIGGIAAGVIAALVAFLGMALQAM